MPNMKNVWPNSNSANAAGAEVQVNPVACVWAEVVVAAVLKMPDLVATEHLRMLV